MQTAGRRERRISASFAATCRNINPIRGWAALMHWQGTRTARCWVIAGLSLMAVSPVWAQRFETLNGPPVQMRPYVAEPGAPQVTVTTGTPAFAGLDTGANGTDTGNVGSATGGATSGTSGSEALTTMLGTSWGGQVSSYAQTMGVNASALAATCVMESGCQNVGGSGTVSGAFQMTNSTYTQDINQAASQNPSLSGSIDTSLAGKMDPANQSIAAAQDLKNAAIALQASGDSNPTFLDARAYYQWGAGAGPSVAAASNDSNMSQVLAPYYSSAQLAANGIGATTTVGQWRQTIINKVGSAATQSVLM